MAPLQVDLAVPWGWPATGKTGLGSLQGWADEAVASAQLEGEILQVNSVRASAARRLGLTDAQDH